MPRAAELVFNTKFNGKAVQNGLSETKKSVESLGDTLSKRFAGAMLAFFSLEKVVQFARAVHEANVEVGKLVSDMEKGANVTKALLELKNKGISPEQAASAKAYTDRIEPLKQDFTGLKLNMPGIISILSRIGMAGAWALRNPDQVKLGSAEQSRQTLIRALGVNAWTDSFGRNAATDLLMPKGLGVRFAQSVAKGNAESDRLATIKYIQDNENDTPNKKEEERDLGFMNVPPVVDIQRKQLQRLDEIAYSLKYNQRAQELLKRTTMFPQ